MSDPTTVHAQRVVAGEFVAGPHVRNACQRHLNDIEHGEERGLKWCPEDAERAISFFSDVLTVEVERTEDGELVSEAVPFDLHESQAFIIGSLFGWRNKNGHRRFRRAYIEMGKGNGKSPLAAGIGHYMLGAMGKLRAEVYSAATDKDQAAILFRDAVEMWHRSPALERRLLPSGQNPVWQLTKMDTASFFKPISSEKKGKSGIRPYCALIDEVHEHPDNSVIEMLRAGTKGNQEALIFEITNSGSDRNSVCWDEHKYTTQVCSGEKENDAWFGYICALDEDDDPLEDESCWIKANPLLGVSIFPEFIREQVQEARGMPSKESLVRRLHFCQWTDGEESWISRRVWSEVEADLDWEKYAGKRCYGGLDLSFTRDLSAFALAFEMKSRLDVFVWFWKPKEGLKDAIKTDRVPYDLFAKDGHLILTPGSVIALGPVANLLTDVAKKCRLLGLAYDRYRHRELEDQLGDEGVHLRMTEHPQGFRRAGENPLWMPRSVEQLENRISTRTIRFAINPLLQYNVAQAVMREDPAGTGGRIFDKRRSRARIDGIVAAAMAVGLAESRKAKVIPVEIEELYA